VPYLLIFKKILHMEEHPTPAAAPAACFKNIVGGLVYFLSVIDVGEISWLGCISNRKKHLFKRSTRTKVFFPAVCTPICTLN
jgi:hypothetical protein